MLYFWIIHIAENVIDAQKLILLTDFFMAVSIFSYKDEQIIIK